MQKRTLGLILCTTLLAAGGCERKEEQAQGAPEETMPGAAAICDSNTMRGTVSLTITGNPGDSFRITYLCDGQLVTECTATIAAGQATATCNAGPTPVPNGGTRTCPVGPGNNNSPAAAVQTSGCG